MLPGRYIATWPVYIYADDPENLFFKVDLDISREVGVIQGRVSEPVQEYRSRMVRTRLYQRSFRERVLYAYRTQCAMCRLRHEELLEAAHIIPDSEPDSPLTIDNGLALCKLHHAAYDTFILGISPDFEIVVREDVLQEEDGPLLMHGLQNLHRSMLVLPKSVSDWPNKDYLDYRYQKFRNAV